MTKVTLMGAAAIILLTSGCGEEELVDTSSETQQEIIGGFRATGKALNAVGTVGMKAFDGRYSYFCSATLIAPKLVLTAKHCAMVLSGPFAGMKLVNVMPIHFAIGPSAGAPIRIVEAIAADLSPLHEGGNPESGQRRRHLPPRRGHHRRDTPAARSGASRRR